MTKKNIIIFSVLGAVILLLLAGIAVAFFTIDNSSDDTPTIDVWEGEDIWGTTVHLAYPMIERADVTKVTLFDENGDSFEFTQAWDELKGANKWVIKGYDSVVMNLSSFELLATWLGTATTKEPIRNATEKQLKDFGVDESCKRGYEIFYKDSTGKEQSHKVRIGNKVVGQDLYYSYIEGRKHVYLLDGDTYSCVTKTKLDYMMPIVNMYFESDTATLSGVKKFAIYKTLSSDDQLLNILTVSSAGKSSGSFNVSFPKDKYGHAISTYASTDHLNSILPILYTSFSGNKVIAIDPDQEELKQYGLSESDQKHFIDVEFYDDAQFASSSYKTKEPSFYVSRDIGGTRYISSHFHGVKMVVSLDSEIFEFLDDSDASLIKWTASQTLQMGFYETLVEDATRSDSPGLSTIILKTPNNEETFILTTETKVNSDGTSTVVLTATAQNSGLVFKDEYVEGSAGVSNQFRVLYTHLLYFPLANDFNRRSDEDIEKIVNENEIVYSITAYRKDGVVVKYDYYALNYSLAMEKIQKGTVDGYGNVTFEKTSYDFIVKQEHIDNVCSVIDKLLAGEQIDNPI